MVADGSVAGADFPDAAADIADAVDIAVDECRIGDAGIAIEPCVEIGRAAEIDRALVNDRCRPRCGQGKGVDQASRDAIVGAGGRPARYRRA